MPMRLEATCRVVTPMFCSGADGVRAELRLPSFKGVLRFWWRALAWRRHDGDLEAIREREDQLFGSAGGGQSRVRMRLAPSDEAPQVCEKGSVLTVPGGDRPVGDGARYLGYGVMEAFASRHKGTEKGQLTRACLRAPFDFTVQMRCGALDEEDRSLLRDALIALGTIGGMGARSRKGYGSLALRSLRVDGGESWKAPRSPKELGDAIRSLGSPQRARTPVEYTAFSEGTRHVLLSGGRIASLEMLNLVGREMIRYRSWGRDGKILGGVQAERNFPGDHHLIKGGRAAKPPRRIAFGLPHTQRVQPMGKLDRRASPLLIHIHECEDAPVAVLSFLPARFLPGKAEISVGGDPVRVPPEKELYAPVHTFLDRLLDGKKRKEPFTEAIEVRP